MSENRPMILTPHMGIGQLCQMDCHMHDARDPWCRESKPRGGLAAGRELVNVTPQPMPPLPRRHVDRFTIDPEPDVSEEADHA